jgi:hypothetical protein
MHAVSRAPLNKTLDRSCNAMVAVKWSELIDAFEFASFDKPSESRAFVNLDTGTFHLISSVVELEEETPEDLETSDRYLALPHKNDLDLGRNLALSFIEQRLPQELYRVEAYFHKRGAYGRFKDLLDERGVLEDWYAFEKDATAQALRQWCDDHGIEFFPEPAV